jgi:hypothetical protein
MHGENWTEEICKHVDSPPPSPTSEAAEFNSSNHGALRRADHPSKESYQMSNRFTRKTSQHRKVKEDD